MFFNGDTWLQIWQQTKKMYYWTKLQITFGRLSPRQCKVQL